MALLLAGADATAEPQFVPDQILVRPKAGLSETNFLGKLRHHGATNRKTFHHLDVRLVAVPKDKAEDILAALQKDPEIDFAERDYVAKAAFLPIDPYVQSGDEWHLRTIQAPEAWGINAGVTNTIVAVLDSGINAAHPDLVTQILPGYDFVNNTADPVDDFGHGTAVSGTIVGAANNGIGIAGVAYGARLLPVKVMNSSGFASYSVIAQGISYAVDQGARVINISIVGSSPSTTLQDAINYAWSNNVVIVAAAGNNANSAPQYPAACDHVVGVSATEPDDSLAWFSSYGDFVTLSAPGDSIWTTQNDLNNPYGAWRGTSFASPIVAGAAALVASENPSLSNTQIVSILEQNADDLGAAGCDASFGYGRVNAYRAVNAASLEPGAHPPGNGAPQVTLSSPADSAQFTRGSTVPIVANAAPGMSSSLITNVLLLANGEPLASLAAAPFAWGWTPDQPGSYALTAVALNDQGLCVTSPPVSIQVLDQAATLVPLIVQTNGCGWVTPNLDGRLLELGKDYRIKAVPGRGQAFAGWTGVDSQSSVLHFIMQSNLTLVANFIPSPFPVVKGSYAGLMANTNGVLPENSGCFRITITRSGLFTGKLFVGGKGRGFRGRLDLAGNAAVPVKRGRLQALQLTLHVDLTNGTDQISGSVTDGGWASVLAGDRNIFRVKFNPAPQAGSRAFILERADNIVVTAATGSSTISKSGRARVRGKLADGRVFSSGSLLARNGDYPFYLSLSRGKEMVIGWLNFPATPSPTASGTVLWVRTGTNAFAATLQAASAP